MNSRVAVVLGGGAVIVALRAVQSGKLKSAWGALWASPPAHAASTSGSGSSPSGGGSSPGTPLPSSGSGHPDSALFGLAGGIQPYDAIVSHYSDAVVAADTAGLQAAGGGPAVHDWDYATAPGTPVKLPGDSSVTYNLVHEDPVSSPWAGLEAFQTPGGGVMEYVHLSQEVPPGTYHGGQIVGQSGQPNNPTYGFGAHLAVIVDRLGARWLGVSS